MNNNHISLVQELLNHHTLYAGAPVQNRVTDLVRRFSFRRDKKIENREIVENTAKINQNNTTLRVILRDMQNNSIIYNSATKRFQAIPVTAAQIKMEEAKQKDKLRITVNAKTDHYDKEYFIVIDNETQVLYLVKEFKGDLKRLSEELSFESIINDNDLNKSVLEFSEKALLVSQEARRVINDGNKMKLVKVLQEEPPPYTFIFPHVR